MCGRYTNTTIDAELVMKRLNAYLAPDFGTGTNPANAALRPSFNIAPTQYVPVVVAKNGTRYLMRMYWGLIPPWGEADPAKGEKPTHQINVRDDTIGRNSFFKNRLQNNRCVFLGDSFYEWKTPDEFRGQPRGTKLPKGVRKTPYRISVKDQDLFAMAGLWRTAQIDEKPVITAAIITTSPNSFMQDIHDRMPVILPDDALATWLDPNCKDEGILRSLLKPYEGPMQAYQVSPMVNSGKIDDPRLIEEVKPED